MADPKIKYDIEAAVKGGDGVQALEKDLRDLGAVLDGDLKTQATAAADAIKALGEKQAAVTGLQQLKNETGALAIELAPFGVRVNALCPSDILSTMLQYQADHYGGGEPEKYFRNLLAHYPQQANARFIQTVEVAHYIAYLLSPMAAPITGAHAMLDFGITAGY